MGRLRRARWPKPPTSIFVMVTDSAALEGVADGPDGLLAGLGAGKLLIDMSTVSPAVSRALAAKVRDKGADMVDAPVSGSVITLEQGKLSIMVGGTARDLRAASSRCSTTSARRSRTSATTASRCR